MRRIMILLAVAALAISAVAAPAAADRPTDYVVEATMPDVDPCTGEDMTVYAVFTGRSHYGHQAGQEHGEGVKSEAD